MIWSGSRGGLLIRHVGHQLAMQISPFDSKLLRCSLVAVAGSWLLPGCGPRSIVLEQIQEIQKGTNVWSIALDKPNVWWEIMFDPYRALPGAALDAGAGAVSVRWSVENAGKHPISVQVRGVHLPGVSPWKSIGTSEGSTICTVPLSNLVYSTASFILGMNSSNSLTVSLVLESEANVRLSRPVEIWASRPWP